MVPSADPEATPPVYHEASSSYDYYQKQAGEMTNEKPQYPAPYDPVYPSQHYDRPDSASIAPSIYNAPPVALAQPQDYSYQHYYYTEATVQPGTYVPPPVPPHY
jgi:hypothetical protein